MSGAGRRGASLGEEALPILGARSGRRIPAGRFGIGGPCDFGSEASRSRSHGPLSCLALSWTLLNPTRFPVFAPHPPARLIVHDGVNKIVAHDCFEQQPREARHRSTLRRSRSAQTGNGRKIRLEAISLLALGRRSRDPQLDAFHPDSLRRAVIETARDSRTIMTALGHQAQLLDFGFSEAAHAPLPPVIWPAHGRRLSDPILSREQTVFERRDHASPDACTPAPTSAFGSRAFQDACAPSFPKRRDIRFCR